MFKKVAAFKMLPTGRPARSVVAAANDNRLGARPCPPRLICRWSLSPETGRPTSRWELDTSDEPSPRLRGRTLARLALVPYGKADAGQHIV